MLEPLHESISTESPLHDSSAAGNTEQVNAQQTSTPPPTTTLDDACAAGNLEQARNLLSVSPDLKSTLHAININGQTPLHVAAENGYHEIVQLILGSCSEENLRSLINIEDSQGYTPYLSALKKNSKKKKSNQDNEKAATYLLAQNKQFAVDWHKKRTKKYSDSHLHLLIHSEFSLDLIRSHLMLLASYSKSANTVYGINEKNQQGFTPLYLAASGSSPELVILLLAYKANPAAEDQFGNNCLHIAVQANKHANVNVFLDNDQKVGLLRDVFYLTRQQKSVFHIAAESADVEMLGLLFQYLRVLFKALNRKNPSEMEEWILSHRDIDGNTAAHLAALARNEENYQYLVESLGAKVSVPNEAGKTANELFTIYTTPPRPPSGYVNIVDSSVSPQEGVPTVPQRSPLPVRSAAHKAPALPPSQRIQLPNAANGVAVIPGTPEAHSGVDAAQGNLPPAVPAPEINSGVNSAYSGDQKTLLQKTWALVSKKPFGEWVKENRTPIIIGAGILIVAAALTTYIALSVALPGSSIFSAIPVVYAVHAAFVALHIPMTIPWLVPAVSIALPTLAIPFEIAIIYDAYVAVKGFINLWSFGENVITKITKIAAAKQEVEDIFKNNKMNYVTEDISQPAASAAQRRQSPNPSLVGTILQVSAPAAEEGEKESAPEERSSLSEVLQSEDPQTGVSISAAPSSAPDISSGIIEAISGGQDIKNGNSSDTTGGKEKRRRSAESRLPIRDLISNPSALNGIPIVANGPAAQPPPPAPAPTNVAMRTVSQPLATPPAQTRPGTADRIDTTDESEDAINNDIINQFNARKSSWFSWFKPKPPFVVPPITSTSCAQQQSEVGRSSAFRYGVGSSVDPV